MIGLALVRSLETGWKGTLDAVARRRRWPTSEDVAELASQVTELSLSYNDASIARATVGEAGAARLGFAFARDVPKGAAAVRELVATGMLRLDGRHPAPPAPALRVLDVGAGLGATTWGLVRALEAAGGHGVVEATLLDADAQALDIAAEVVRERAIATAASSQTDPPPAGQRIELRVTTVARPVGSIGALDALGSFDVVLVGQLLSELDVGAPAELRAERHAALVGQLLDRRLADHGALVIIEPALRDRTRHLHRVRDRLAALGANVFAPCMHALPCPALAGESDWCHEDIPVDLPRWLVPVSRAAGLRREGLTFSYLVLRKDGVRLADLVAAPPGAARLRVVSEAIPSKGKHEAFVCGEFTSSQSHLSTAQRLRAMRLDRDACNGNSDWAELMRGDVLVVDPPLTLERPRIDARTKISRSTERAAMDRMSIAREPDEVGKSDAESH